MQRTNTTNVATFDLPFPDAATFTFPSSSEPSPTSSNDIRITIPPLSSWRMRLHWHPSESHAASTAVCERVTRISGYLQVSTIRGISGGGIRMGSGGMSVKFKPGERVGWGRDRSRQRDSDSQPPLTVDLTVGEHGHTLWRNVCSAALDRDIFPKLDSTPLWLKALFRVLGIVRPSWREGLLGMMHWIQIQTMFFAHDFRMYHGRVPLTWPWMMQPFGGRPPDRVKWLELWSKYVIAWAVMNAAYWVGRLFLGMKGEYVEYTPLRVHRDEKS